MGVQRRGDGASCRNKFNFEFFRNNLIVSGFGAPFTVHELFLLIMEENAQELHYCKVSDFHVVGSGTYLAFRSRDLR